MAFEYATFISYRNSRSRKNGLLDTFARELAALERCVDAHLFEDISKNDNQHQVFLDKEIITSGDWICDEIAKGINKSVCWIIVFTRSYLGGSYFCASELCGMLNVYEHRKQRLEAPELTNLVIPLLFRGEIGDLPSHLQGMAVDNSFMYYNLATGNLAENPEFAQKVEDLAMKIASLQKIQMDLQVQHNINLANGVTTFQIHDVYKEEGKQQIKNFITQLRDGRAPNVPAFPTI